MKTLYLLRHAKSSWKDPALDDFDRPLNKRGKKAAALIGSYLRQNGVEPAQILCSPSRRTRQTLERLHDCIGEAIPIRFEKSIYLAEATTLLKRLRRLSDSLPSVMVVGHNPGLERLAEMLTDAGAGEHSGENSRRLAEKFPTAALAVLAADIEHWRDLRPGCARLDAFVHPRDLQTE